MSASAGPHSRSSSQFALSDEQLRRQVSARLAQFGPRVARDVVAVIRGGDVTLSGVVDGDYERQLIAQVIERIAGISLLENELKVRADVLASDSSGFGIAVPAHVRRLAVAAAAACCLAIGWGIWMFALEMPR